MAFRTYVDRVMRLVKNTKRRLNQNSYFTYGCFKANKLDGFLMTRPLKNFVDITDWMGSDEFYSEAVKFLFKTYKNVRANCLKGHPFLQKVAEIKTDAEIMETGVGMFRRINFKMIANILRKILGNRIRKIHVKDFWIEVFDITRSFERRRR